MGYYEQVSEINRKIELYNRKLENLDDDYKKLQECKQTIARMSVFLNDLMTQCGDIKKVFDRETLEGKYDTHQITFKNKNLVFELLDNIVSLTNDFNIECGFIKEKIDNYGTSLDDYCINIAEEAKAISNEISSLKNPIYRPTDW